MKKLLAILLVFAMCIGLCACKSCEHQYAEAITKEATCTEVGEKTFTCSLCNESYTEEIPVIPHSFGEATVTKEATCTEEGEKSVTCTACGYSEVQETVPMTEHTFGEATVTKDATCKEEGEKSVTCVVCGVTQITETIAKTAHSYTSETTKAPTCTAVGTKTDTCSVCQKTTTTEVPATGHTYSDKIERYANCTTVGIIRYTCKNCSHNYTEEVPAMGHDYRQSTEVAATCTVGGVSKYTCADCGDTYTKSVAATGHKWANATCTKAKSCSSCGVTDGSPLGHTTDNGTCSRCGEEFSITDKCTLVLENADMEFRYRGYTYCKLSDISWTFESYSGGIYIKLDYKLTKTKQYGNVTDSCYAAYKLYGPDGTVLETGNFYAFDLSVGETMKGSATLYTSGMDVGKYVLKFENP